MDDATLLRQYVHEGSETAFEELVARYTPLVYSSALRRAGNRHAEDVTQAVFIILARKAARVERSAPKTLAGWLHRTARFAASEALRGERRRAERERKAHEEQEERMIAAGAENASWRDVSPLLESALDRLASRDRQAVLLRLMQGQSYAAVGASLGTSENTATKRVSRALERMRRFLERRGVTLSGATLAGLLTAQAVEAVPAGLAAACSASAFGAAGAAGTTVAGGVIAQAATKAMAVAQAKTATLATCAVVASGLGTAAIVDAVVPKPIDRTVHVVEIARFPLAYKGVSTLPDGRLEFQLNTRGARKTFFLKEGEELSGWRIVGHVPGRTVTNRGSSIVLEKDASRVTLPFYSNGSHGPPMARLQTKTDRREVWLRLGDILSWETDDYRVDELHPESNHVVVTRLSDNRTYVLKQGHTPEGRQPED